MAYQGRQPGVGVRNRFIYTATASQTTFSGTDSNGLTLAYQDGAYVDVYLNGVLLIPVTDYTSTTKTSVTLTTGATSGDAVEILCYDIASMADTVSKSSGGTFDGAVTVAGNFSVDGGTIKLDGNYPVGTNNVALGDAALDSNVSGASNVAIGADALTANTAGNNTAVGFQAGYSNTTGTLNSYFGYKAGYAVTTQVANTMVGYQAGLSTVADANTFVGYQSGQTNSTGTNNTALAVNALYNNTSGSNNTALGREALFSNTTANANTAVGYQAGYSATGNCPDNTVVGYQAGYYLDNLGGYNTFVGAYAGTSVTTGQENQFFGRYAGNEITTGSKNTIIGKYNGNTGGLDIRTSSNNIVLSDGDGNPRVHIDSTGGIDHKTTGDALVDHYATNASYGGLGVVSRVNRTSTGGNYFFFTAYDDASSTYRYYVHDSGNVYNVNNSYGGISDVKLKENIIDSGSQWDDIKALRVRKYSMKADSLDAPNMLGVIAQELEAAGMSGLVYESPDRDADGNVLDTTTKQVSYSILYMKAVKALQEAMTRIETLEAKVTALEGN